jgi:regulation of enolase protein 1 (concanavalin A-like superfamily)
MMSHALVLSSLLLVGAGAGGDVLFEEKFDGKLQPAWKWIRPDVDEWRIQDNELQVRSQFGRIWGGNDAKNVLVIRPSKTDNVEARVNVAHAPREKWEQAGLLWYVDDDNFVKFISEQIDGKMYAVICREQGGRGRVFGKVEAPSANMQLRLMVRGNHLTGQWRIKETDPWSDSGSCQFDVPGDRYFGLFTQNGPKDKVRWVRFDSFVITELTK